MDEEDWIVHLGGTRRFTRSRIWRRKGRGRHEVDGE